MNNPAFTRYPVLYRDKWLLVIDKPAGVLSHPNPAKPNGGVRKPKASPPAFEGTYRFSERTFETLAGRLWLIHRLDQDTSGVLLAALDKKSAEVCRSCFEEREVEKKYAALVSGRPHPAEGKWRDYVSEHKQLGRVRAFCQSGRPPNAELRYTVKEFFPRLNLSFLEITLITGRTHQIRVQSAFRGFPVAGDGVYGNFSLNRKWRKEISLNRLFLHACALSFKHPAVDKQLKIESPLPAKLAVCLTRTS